MRLTPFLLKRGAGKSRANDPLLLALNAKPPERTEASGVAKGKSEGEKRKEVAGRRSGGLAEAELIGFQSGGYEEERRQCES